MKVIQNNLAASSLSSIVQYTMNTLPPKIRPAQQANLHRETPQARINTSMRQKLKPCQARGHFASDIYSWLPHVRQQRSTPAWNRDRAWLCSSPLFFQSIQEIDILSERNSKHCFVQTAHYHFCNLIWLYFFWFYKRRWTPVRTALHLYFHK